MSHKPYGPYEKFIKRPLDFLCAFLALIVLLPVLLVTAILVRIKLGTPILFTQERPGQIDSRTDKERIFKLYKFRTMKDIRGADGELLPDNERLTPFGTWLRKSSIDELPELINIIKGDMSFVGPRPLLVAYLPCYSDEERHRHDVRPGLTGLAQVKGRSFLSWEDIFSFDLEYVNHCSFYQDIYIIVRTAMKVLVREEIADINTITVDENGDNWVIDNGVKRRLHRPLNEERPTC